MKTFKPVRYCGTYGCFKVASYECNCLGPHKDDEYSGWGHKGNPLKNYADHPKHICKRCYEAQSSEKHKEETLDPMGSIYTDGNDTLHVVCDENGRPISTISPNLLPEVLPQPRLQQRTVPRKDNGGQDQIPNS